MSGRFKRASEHATVSECAWGQEALVLLAHLIEAQHAGDEGEDGSLVAFDQGSPGAGVASLRAGDRELVQLGALHFIRLNIIDGSL